MMAIIASAAADAAGSGGETLPQLVAGGAIGVVTTLVGVLVKKGFSASVKFGQQDDPTGARVVQRAKPDVCPLHDGLVADVAEIKTDIKKLLFHLVEERTE